MRKFEEYRNSVMEHVKNFWERDMQLLSRRSRKIMALSGAELEFRKSPIRRLLSFILTMLTSSILKISI